MSTTHQVIIGFGITVEKSKLLDAMINNDSNDSDDFDEDADIFKRYFEDDYHYILLNSSIIDQDSDCVEFDPQQLKYKQSEYNDFIEFLIKYKIVNTLKWYAFRWSF